MAAETEDSGKDYDINIDLRRLEAGLDDGQTSSNRDVNDSQPSGEPQSWENDAAEGLKSENGTSSPPTAPHFLESEVDAEYYHQQKSKPVWSEALDWIKQKRSRRPSELSRTRTKTSTTGYSKFDYDSASTHEDLQGPEKVYDSSWRSKDEAEAQSQSYTKAAEETVQTFLRQDTVYQGAATEEASLDQHIYDIDYVPAPEKYKPGLFGALLAYKFDHLQQDWEKEQNQNLGHQRQPAKHDRKGHHQSQSLTTSLPSSGTATPSKKVRWYDKPGTSNPTAAALMQAALLSTSPGVGGAGAIPRPQAVRPKSADMISTAVDIITHGKHQHHRHQNSNSSNEKHVGLITEVADIIARREYLTKLCGALMEYGAPTHRLEEYLSASARALLIEADFLHIPGAMICTFADRTIHANNVDIVKKRGGLDFARLRDVFDVYKCVIHEKLTAEDGIYEIDNIRRRPDTYSDLFRIVMFGVASVVVGPFSFQTRPIDFGPIFLLGCAIGFMQVKVVPRSEHFSNVFEVFACVFAAFIARALGSIKYSDGGYIFCFSGMAQSTIAMILPGFMMLNSALELQSRNLISGSVRMVYVIVYVLFLAFGLLIGTTIFGLIKSDAVSSTTCDIPPWFAADMDWKLIHTRFIWAPLFACCVGFIYQARWRQLPVMALIAVCGHQANFWISTQLSSNPQVANAIGAFVIGCISNLYSRLFHGLAATAMLPAIYCQVPGGLASSGSLVAGVVSANEISGNRTAIDANSPGSSASTDGTIFTVGYGMVQVAIGISVGLYLSALVVYPYGKRKSALGSF